MVKQKGFDPYEHMRAYPKIGWDFWWDPRPRAHLVGETCNSRPGTLKVEPKTCGPGPNSQVGLRTLKVGPKTQDLGHLF